MGERRFAPGARRAEGHLVEQVRTEDVSVTQVSVVGVLWLNRGEIRIDRRRAECHKLIGRAVKVSVDPILAIVELMVNTRLPFDTVAWQCLFERPNPGHREIAGDLT